MDKKVFQAGTGVCVIAGGKTFSGDKVQINGPAEVAVDALGQWVISTPSPITIIDNKTQSQINIP